MLKGNPNVFHYSTFESADKLFAQHPIWQHASKTEVELKRLVFEEYVDELKERQQQDSRASRTRAVNKLVSLLKDLEVDVLTRWRTAHKMILDSVEWNTDAELRKLPTLDLLLAFEDYSRLKEREWEEVVRKTEVEKARKERKAREAFRQLLHSLVQSGDIKARTKWKDIFPLIEHDERYLNMLGQPGSNQLELFWDIVDDLDIKLDRKIGVVQEMLSSNAPPATSKSEDVEMTTEETKLTEVKPETTREEFMAAVQASEFTEEELKEIFDTVCYSSLSFFRFMLIPFD